MKPGLRRGAAAAGAAAVLLGGGVVAGAALTPGPNDVLGLVAVAPEDVTHDIPRGEWRDDVNPEMGWGEDRTAPGCRAAFYADPSGPALCGAPTEGLSRDHMVAWAEALQSGADDWPRSKQLDFYNDTDNLYVLGQPENRAKSDYDAAEWRPEDPAQWCLYSYRVLDIKAKWGLTVDAAERDALAGMLATC